MKRILPAAIAATIAVVAAAHGQGAPTTLHLVDHNTGFAFNDVKPKQLPKQGSLGDTLTIAGRLTGDRTGTDALTCAIIRPGKHGAELCQGVAHLADGDFFFSGRQDENDKPASLAVTGGTGAYASASGTILTRDGKHDTTVITVTLGG